MEWDFDQLFFYFSACFIFYRKHKNKYVILYFDVTFNPLYISTQQAFKSSAELAYSSAVKGLTSTCDRPGFESPALHQNKRSDSRVGDGEGGHFKK